MNLFKSLKNKKGMSGAVKGAMIFLTLAFVIASVSYIIPALAVHNSIVTIDPLYVDAGTEYTFTDTVLHDTGPDDIREVRIYNNTLGHTNFACGNPPSGWSLIDQSADYSYCQYQTNSDKILLGQSRNFTFKATMTEAECNKDQCAHSFRTSTLDDKEPQGDIIYNYPQVYVDCFDPVTTKTYGDPHYPADINSGAEYPHYINSSTPITLTATDTEGGICDSGVKEIHWRDVVVDDNECRGECLCDEETCTEALWNVETGNTVTIYKPEQSCHIIQYYAIDKVGNEETVKTQCVFVDNTPPTLTKIVGSPNVTCDNSDPSGCVYWVTQNTPIDLYCTDQGNHPVDQVSIWYRIWDDVSNTWSSWTDSVALPEAHKTLYFGEDSIHILEAYCVDALGNAGPIDNETFKVDTLPPTIIKTMIGDDHLGDCPPGASPTAPCYVKDSGENGVHVAVQDHGDICAVDQITCNYELWWKTDLDTCIKKVGPDHLYNPETGQCFVEGGQFGDAGKDIIFTQDSEHILKINCKDALGNAMPEDVETFLVDSTPPVTTKTYGDPHYPADINSGAEYPHYINSSTLITLSATDNKVGVDKTYYAVSLIDNHDCEDEEDCVVDYVADGATIQEYTAPFTIGESSCHQILFYSVDKLGNIEEKHRQCVYVDNTPPEPVKEVGEPKVSGGGECGSINVTKDLDVFFLFDTTGSMGGVLSSAQTNANNVMSAISALVTNSNFGVGSFKDYAGSFSSCGYSNTYGDAGNTPWTLNQDITSNTVDVSTAINSLFASGGADGPEAYARALWETQSISWRSGTKRVVVIFNDNVPHDCNLGSFDSCTSTTGADPGPDGVTGTGDDITWNGVTAQLKAAGISVISIDSGSATTCRDAVWGYVASETGGARAMLGSDFTKTIVDLVTEVIGNCSNKIDWYVTKNTPITLNCDDSNSSTTPHPVGQEKVYWRFSTWADGFEGDPTYSDWYSETYDKLPVEVKFTEDCWHDLEYYCVDHLGNAGKIHRQYYIVETVPPVINKTIEGPQLECPDGVDDFKVDDGIIGDCHMINGVTNITIDAYDPQPHPVDDIKCNWWYMLDDTGPFYLDADGKVQSGESPLVEIPFKINFKEDTEHILHVKCEDALHNSVDDVETFLVDKTPPAITKTYGSPFFSPDGNVTEWINNTTPITISVEDAGPHKSGIKETKYRWEIVADENCLNVDACQKATIDSEWNILSDPTQGQFTIPEDSCHLIEITSTDNVDKSSIIKQCVFVDNTPPEVTKIISEPYEKWEGDDTFYPGLKARCAVGEIDCWKLTMGNTLNITCTDPEPHPVDHNEMCFQIELDGDDVTEKYCDSDLIKGEFNATGDGYCCKESGIESFKFGEESQHDLKVKCMDALGNAGTIDEEKFKVEGCTLELCLYKKWNLISVPFTLLNDSPSEVFKDAKDEIVSVWTYDNGTWYSWIPGVGGTLEHIKPGWGYWVLSKEDKKCFDIAGSLFTPLEVPPSRELQSGWNLIGYYGSTGMSVSAAFDVVDGKCHMISKPVYCALNSLIDTHEGFPRWSSLWNYFNIGGDVAGWRGLDACIDGEWKSEMDPGKGYWIEMDVKDGYAPATNCIWNTDLACVSEMSI